MSVTRSVMGRLLRRKPLPLFIILGLCLVYFHRVLSGEEVAITDSYARFYPWRTTAPDSLVARPAWNTDNIELFYPRRAYATARAHEGSLPLWEPWTAGGTPFFANPQNCLFYPLNWPLLLGDAGTGMGRFLLIHFALAGVGSLLLLRRLGLPSGAALFGSLCFMWNGYFLTRTGHPTQIASGAWLPWALFALVGLRERPSVRRAVALAVPLALSFLAGFPQGFLFIAYLVGTVLAVDAFRALPGPGTARRLSSIALVPLLVVGFSAVQLVPMIELFGQSARQSMDYETLLSSAQHPAMIVRAVLPEHFGSPLDPGGVQTSQFIRGNGYFAQSYVSTENYAGLLPLALAFVGVATWRHRWRRPMVALALISLLLAFGSPLLRLYSLLPGLAVSRVDRVALLYFLAISVLAAGGLGTILESMRARAPHARGAVPVAVASCAILLLVADLLPYGLRYNVSQPRAALPELGGRLAQLRDPLARVVRVGAGAGAIYPGSVGACLAIPTTHGMSELPLRRWHELYDAIEPGAFSRQRLEPLQRPESLLSPILTLLGARYLLILVPEGERARVEVVERPLALPRAFVVPRYEVIADPASRLERLSSPEFDPSSVAVLEETPSEWTEGTGSATIEAWEPERVVVRVEGSGGGLVLTDNWYPGWTVTVDGEPARVLIADHALRLVPLPPGHHELLFRFRPRSLQWGAALSLMTLVGASVALASERRSGASSRAGE